MEKEKSCGAVVFKRIDGIIKYVIIKQLEGFHGFPKGHVEANETEEETALREIYEEIGIKPTLIKGFRTVDEHINPKKNTIKQIIYFLAEYDNQEIVYQKEELLEASLMTYEEAMNTFEYESSKKILTEANDYLNNAII